MSKDVVDLTAAPAPKYSVIRLRFKGQLPAGGHELVAPADDHARDLIGQSSAAQSSAVAALSSGVGAATNGAFAAQKEHAHLSRGAAAVYACAGDLDKLNDHVTGEREASLRNQHAWLYFGAYLSTILVVLVLGLALISKW